MAIPSGDEPFFVPDPDEAVVPFLAHTSAVNPTEFTLGLVDINGGETMGVVQLTFIGKRAGEIPNGELIGIGNRDPFDPATYGPDLTTVSVLLDPDMAASVIAGVRAAFLEHKRDAER